MRDFIRDHLGPAFAKAGLETEIWLGTINSDDYNEYANTVLSDPGAAKYVRGIGYQWWGKSCIQRTHLTWPDVPLMQTENECGDGRNTWAYSHYIFDLVWHYFTNGVVGYIYWNMILPSGGESTWGWNQNSMICVDKKSGAVTYNPEFWVMKHFSRYVKPGAVRLGLKGPWSGNALAFENRDGTVRDGTVAVVAANPFAERKRMTLGHAGRTWKLDLEPKSFHTFVLDDR
jgi:glucosylceramidase